MEDILIILAYMIIGGIIGFGIKCLMNNTREEKKLDDMTKRLDDWQKIENERYINKKKY
jgi:hypothetical protein